MIITDFIAGVREIFSLRAARATTAGYGERLAQVRREKAAARERLSIARRLANPHAALDVLKVAFDHARRAAQLARAGDSVDAAPVGDPGDSFGRAEALREDLETRTTRLLASIEARTETELLGLRVGRVAALVVIALLVVRAVVHHYGVHNVALDKPVIASSLAQSKPASGVVDGRTRDTFGIHTAEGPHPFILIDLTRTYRIRSIRVFNRGDGWFDEVLPLSIELSLDGITFHEVARRTTHFDVWDIPLGDADARYVRATKESGYIALNEIEVYSRE